MFYFCRDRFISLVLIRFFKLYHSLSVKIFYSFFKIQCKYFFLFFARYAISRLFILNLPLAFLYLLKKYIVCVCGNKLHPTVPHMVTKRLHFNHTIESSFSYRKKRANQHKIIKRAGTTSLKGETSASRFSTWKPYVDDFGGHRS